MVFESRGQKTTRYQPLTSLCCQIRSHDMEEKRERGRYCVAGPPNQQSCQNRSFTRGIQMYQMQLPADPAVRAKWVQFVRRHSMISRTRRQNTLHSVRLISRICVMNAEVLPEKGRNPNEGYYYSTRSRRT